MSNVVAVQEGGKLEMSFIPEGMVLPAEKSTVRIEPMKLVVGRGDFVSKVVNLLGLKDRSAPFLPCHSAFVTFQANRIPRVSTSSF